MRMLMRMLIMLKNRDQIPVLSPLPFSHRKVPVENWWKDVADGGLLFYLYI